LPFLLFILRYVSGGQVIASHDTTGCRQWYRVSVPSFFFFFGKHGELHEKKTAGKQQGDNKIKDKITLAGFLALYVAIVLAMAFAIPVLGTMAAH